MIAEVGEMEEELGGGPVVSLPWFAVGCCGSDGKMCVVGSVTVDSLVCWPSRRGIATKDAMRKKSFWGRSRGSSRRQEVECGTRTRWSLLASPGSQKAQAGKVQSSPHVPHPASMAGG